MRGVFRYTLLRPSQRSDLYGAAATGGGGGGGGAFTYDYTTLDTAPLPSEIGNGTGEALLNFVTGTFTVEGVTKTFRQVFDDSETNSPGYGKIGEAFRQQPFPGGPPGPGVRTNWGFLSDYMNTGFTGSNHKDLDADGDYLGAVAIGRLAELMMAPHTGIIELEDLDAGGSAMQWTNDVYGSAVTAWTTASTQFYTMTFEDYWVNFNFGSGDLWKDGGINTFAYTVGIANSEAAMNGQTSDEGPQDTTKFFNRPPAKHRYWRVYFTATPGGNYFALANLVANDIDQTGYLPASVLTGATLTASSTQSGFPVSNLLDGDDTTYWRSASGDNQGEWIDIDFGGSPKFLDRLYGTYPEGDVTITPYGVKLLYSDDASAWTEVMQWAGTESTGFAGSAFDWHIPRKEALGLGQEWWVEFTTEYGAGELHVADLVIYENAADVTPFTGWNSTASTGGDDGTHIYDNLLDGNSSTEWWVAYENSSAYFNMGFPRRTIRKISVTAGADPTKAPQRIRVKTKGTSYIEEETMGFFCPAWSANETRTFTWVEVSRGPNAYAQWAMPLGADNYNESAGGFIRWLAIKSPTAAQADPTIHGPLAQNRTPQTFLTYSTLLAENVTATSAVLRFDPTTSADAKCFDMIEGDTAIYNASNPPNYAFAFVEDGTTITGLTPATSYSFNLRCRNEYGPGPMYDWDQRTYFDITFTTPEEDTTPVLKASLDFKNGTYTVNGVSKTLAEVIEDGSTAGFNTTQDATLSYSPTDVVAGVGYKKVNPNVNDGSTFSSWSAGGAKIKDAVMAVINASGAGFTAVFYLKNGNPSAPPFAANGSVSGVFRTASGDARFGDGWAWLKVANTTQDSYATISTNHTFAPQGTGQSYGASPAWAYDTTKKFAFRVEPLLLRVSDGNQAYYVNWTTTLDPFPDAFFIQFEGYSGGQPPIVEKIDFYAPCSVKDVLP